MKPAPFEYVRPTTLAEACAILARDEDARVLAGGQTLIPLLAMRLARPTMLVDIGRLPELGGITREGDCIVVGATTRQADAERAALIAEAVPLLAKALPWVGHPATRNRGTIGGSIANADPSAEIPLVAVTLGAQIVTDDGSAVVLSAAGDFFVGPMLTAIRPAACVTQIRFPVWSHGRVGVGFHEVSTRRSDFALVSAAAQVALNDAGCCVAVAVGVGGAGDRPVRLEVSSLRLSALDPAAISMAVATAVADLEVSHDRYVSAAYRRRAAAVLLNRALNDARDDAKRRAADARGAVR
jgi:CO/xanthine dehydrogenase FAD-binding subunit